MEYKIGMYGGSFNPLHLGHVNNIIRASNQCEKLYVVLSNSSDKDEIDHRERFMWLKSITADMENIDVFEIFDNENTKQSHDWEIGATNIKKHIGCNIDVVFAGDDYKERNIWEKLYKESKIVYFSRNEINISSTEIRNNPYEYFNFLPNIVKQYYTKKICIIGTESCGKTTLVRNLAKYFNTTYVEEAGRYTALEAGGIENMQPYHYFQILFKQKQLESTALENANKILLIDTDSLITLYYYELGFSDTKEINNAFYSIAQNISILNNYDLYIFLEPDVKWVPEKGSRIYGDEQIRNINNKKLKKIFDKNNISYISISGNYEERYTKAKNLIEQELLSKEICKK